MKIMNKIIGFFLGLAMATGIGAGVIAGTNKEAVRVEAAGDVTDTITSTMLPATGTTYKDFSNIEANSNARYAGNSAKNSAGAIQMRSKNSNSGIVSTTSGGIVKSVKITVESGTNTIDVYGNNTVYASASDLYASNNRGTKVGSLTATGTITFTDEYAYLGIRSNNGAIYITQIEVVWMADICQHNWGEWETTTLATCTTAGEKTRECSLCHAHETEVIPAGHTFEGGVCTVCGELEATSIIINPSDGTPTTGDWSISKNNITISTTASALTSDQMKVYKYQTLTISSSIENIIRIKFECTNTGTKQYGPGCFSKVSGYFYDEKIGQYLGQAKTIKFTAETNQVRIEKITIWLASKANWCEAFSDVITCDASGEKQPWATKWPMLKNAYTGLGDSDKNDLKTLNNNVTQRYDYIVGKYGTAVYEDFIGRNPAPIVYSKTLAPFNNTDSIAIVTVLAILGTTIILASVVIRQKRKEN